MFKFLNKTKEWTINNIKYIIKYSNIKNWRVKINSEWIMILKIPYLMYFSKSIEKKLLEKWLILIEKYNINNSKKIKTITDNSIIIFWKKVALKDIKWDSEKYIKELFLKESKKNLDIYSKKIGIPYQKLTVRYLKSKWWSCSYNNNISLNLYLVHLPKKFLEYVIIHEVCHLKEKNHSKDFWKLVKVYSNNYKDIKNEMKKFFF